MLFSFFYIFAKRKPVQSKAQRVAFHFKLKQNRKTQQAMVSIHLQECMNLHKNLGAQNTEPNCTLGSSIFPVA
jgi:hypothetical protein